MKKRLSLALVTSALVAASIATPAASAASEFGSGCAADLRFSGGEISIAHSGLSPLPTTAPVSGVLTEWKLNVGALEPPEAGEPGPVLFQELYVVRPAGTNHYLAIGRADSGNVLANTINSYPARIPIQQGDLLGLGGPSTLYCSTSEPPDKTVDFRGLPPVGAIFETGEPLEAFQVPVTAKIEPDADGDGYGDETQDGCPQSAAYHEACPIVSIGSLPSTAAKTIVVNVSTSLAAPVAVSATVPLGKGMTTLTAPTQTVSPGAIVSFDLSLTPKVTKALKALPKKRYLMVTITSSATNVTGAPSVSTATVKLRGRGETPAKPKTHKKHAPKK